MYCIVCHQKIKSGEQIFWGSQMECCGNGEIDCSSSGASDGLMGAIHLFCLESLIEAAKQPNTAVCEPVVEESVVARSDALSLLWEVEI
jgi:hypothetical protein